jgi:hypothetical protein
MDQMTNATTETAATGRLSYSHTEKMLRDASRADTDTAHFDGLHLDREAAAAFIADQATLLSAVAHAAGLSTVKIISDLLYVNAFGDVSSSEMS